MKKHIGENLADLAKSENLTQSHISDKIGVSYPQLNKFFNGKSNLSLEHFLELLKVFNLDVYEIIQLKINEKNYDLDRKTNITNFKDALFFLFQNIHPEIQLNQIEHLERLNEIYGNIESYKKLKPILTSSKKQIKTRGNTWN